MPFARRYVKPGSIRMTCEKARRSVVIGRRWPFGRRAERHVKDCPDCAKWLGSVTEMAELLEKVPRHEQPARLAQRLVAEVRTACPRRPTAESGRQ